MRNLGHPLVPMLVHQVVNYSTRSLGEVGIYILGCLRIFNIGNHHYVLFIGRDEEAVDSVLDIADTLTIVAVGIHNPHLVDTVIRIKECNLSTAVNPHGIVFRLRCTCQALDIAAVDIHYIEVAV